MKIILRAIWQWLRTVSGDDAYDRYMHHHLQVHPEKTPLTRRAFYDEHLTQKWSGVNRCC